MRVSVYIKQNIEPISVSTMIFLLTWSTNLAQNLLSIDFEAVKIRFSFTLTIAKIIYGSSAGATVV
jgi:hypothetical protein